MWYPNAFTPESQKKMAAEIELISVEENEARHFACNAVVLGKNVVLPADCPGISNALEQRGYTVHPCDMKEYLKSGGACKCLTLRID
jgi:N-dimethylarginine dimethylaminohydrolase